jgi:hypothetical protein
MRSRRRKFMSLLTVLVYLDLVLSLAFVLGPYLLLLVVAVEEESTVEVHETTTNATA